MKISKAIKEDIKYLLKIESEVFKNDSMAIKLSSFYYHIKNNFLFKIEKNNKVVGYILWLKRKNFIRLYSLAVLDEFRGLGIASKLLEFSFEKLEKKTIQLEVRKSNEKAISLYKKFQFKEVKVLKDFYKDEDGILMRLER